VQVSEALQIDADGTSGSGEPAADPCGRVLAVLLTGADPCALAAGTEVVVAPLSGTLYAGRRYRAWRVGTVAVEDAAGSGLESGSNEELQGSSGGTFALYAAEGETRKEVVTDVSCVDGDLVVTTDYVYSRGGP
jgi:hypothetical protein